MEPSSPDGPFSRTSRPASVLSNRLFPLPDVPERASLCPADNSKLIFSQIQLPETLRQRLLTLSRSSDFWLVPGEEVSLECIAEAFTISISLAEIMSKNHHLLKRKHWIFDLDGTLTIAVHDFNAIRKELGIPEGQPIIKTLESLPAKESRKQKKKLQEIEEMLALNASPAPGVKRLLEALSRQNYFLGILTLNTRENAWTTLKVLGLSEYFTRESVIGRWCAEPKPSTEGIKKLLNHWNVCASETLIVGDYLYDLQVGRATEIATVHVDPSGSFSWPELADISVCSLNELTDMLH